MHSLLSSILENVGEFWTSILIFNICFYYFSNISIWKMCVCVCVHVCVKEREKEKERETRLWIQAFYLQNRHVSSMERFLVEIKFPSLLFSCLFSNNESSVLSVYINSNILLLYKFFSLHLCISLHSHVFYRGDGLYVLMRFVQTQSTDRKTVCGIPWSSGFLLFLLVPGWHEWYTLFSSKTRKLLAS
jgi:hypothetical protein